jgi:uncharacterized protein YndB with AHSA1/START domain
MKNAFILMKAFAVKSSRVKVWDALTNPALIKKYFFGTDTDTTWEVGSPIVYRGVWEGRAYEDKGTILANDFLTRIQFNYWSSFSGKPDVPENYAVITFQLEETNGITNLTVTQDNIESEEILKHSEENWTMVMNGLKQLVENQL